VTFARVRRRLFQAAVVLVFLVLAGATYQGVATAVERRQFPQPGHLTNVGGHQLHIYCTGEGSPTVVLEAPAAGMSAAWGWVQPEIAKITRVCSYDRAGLGWSEAGDSAFDPAAASEQLEALLARHDETGPFVLAGHGFGAALARLHAQRFGSNAAAVVMIDPPADLSGGTTRLVNISPWLARAGVLRATGMLSAQAAGLPDPSAGALRAFLNRPDHLTRAARELDRWEDTVALASRAALPSHVGVTDVRIVTGDAVAFLSDERDAAAATRTILEAVAESR
jgi:pimeloyl-ACP methyl ester carboxylesterase